MCLRFSIWEVGYSEGLSDCSHFFLILCPLLGLRLAVSDFSDEFVKSDHIKSYLNLSRSKLINDGGYSSAQAQGYPREYRGECVSYARTRSSTCDS